MSKKIHVILSERTPLRSGQVAYFEINKSDLKSLNNQKITTWNYGKCTIEGIPVHLVPNNSEMKLIWGKEIITAVKGEK